MLKRKQFVVQATNTQLLFDIGEEFKQGQVWVTQVSQTGAQTYLKVDSEVGTWIKFATAPVDCTLMILFETDAISDKGGLTDYDYMRLERIAQILKLQAEQIQELVKAVENRITKKEMLRWQDAMRVELDKLNTSVNLLP